MSCGKPGGGIGDAVADFGGVFAGGVLATFVEVGAEAAGAMVGDEGAEGSTK